MWLMIQSDLACLMTIDSTHISFRVNRLVLFSQLGHTAHILIFALFCSDHDRVWSLLADTLNWHGCGTSDLLLLEDGALQARFFVAERVLLFGLRRVVSARRIKPRCGLTPLIEAGSFFSSDQFWLYSDRTVIFWLLKISSSLIHLALHSVSSCTDVTLHDGRWTTRCLAIGLWVILIFSDQRRWPPFFQLRFRHFYFLFLCVGLGFGGGRHRAQISAIFSHLDSGTGRESIWADSIHSCG